ncbi:hypothetical protein BKA56DRAFT_105064 [Ilyonectria sp. MPI-CAGE-AT-0026]|nr:hypothetical protein BKA56DRAFT_105064 [Ilyonectria sp. MPI-CAGE-AT-0026]
MGAPPASELAVQCLAQFDECLLNHALAHNQWADNRRADFNIWVDGVGAMAGKTASLDARFESRPRELILTKNLLFQLGYYLEDALTVTDERELEEVKRNVDTSIENLASMAIAIRRTGRKSRLVRADASFNSASLDDFRKHLEFIVRLRPTLPGYRHPSHHKNKPHWWQRHLSAKLNPLQQRLIEANLRRRNRFLYAQSHSRKLAYRQLDEDLAGHQPQTGELIKHRYSKGNPTSQLPVRGVSAQHNLGTAKHRNIMPALSETLASTPESKLKWTEPNNRVRVAMTQMSRVTGTTLYPNLRKPQQSEAQGMDQDETELPKMLKCPCCCEAIPSSMLKVESAWKKHLSKDLCPYTCIATNCPTPHILYCTRAEWEDHLKEQHPKTWKCQLCDDPGDVVFHTDDQLVDHVSEEHMDSFPASLLGAVRLWPSSPSIGLKSCPLCYKTGPRDSPSLIDHVLEHTHSFALRSLPWADVSVANFEKSGTFEWYNVSCLQPRKPTEPTASLHQWLLHDWFEKFETPTVKDGEWERAEAALGDLAASRARVQVMYQDDYFATNDYFASDTEGPSQPLSRNSFDSEPETEPAESDGNAPQWGGWSYGTRNEQSQGDTHQLRNNDADLDTEWYTPNNELTICDSDQDVPGYSNKPKGKDPEAEPLETDENESQEEDWSNWIWSEDYERYYRQRHNTNGDLETEWHEKHTTYDSDQDGSELSTESRDEAELYNAQDDIEDTLPSIEAAQDYGTNFYAFDDETTTATAAPGMLLAMELGALETHWQPQGQMNTKPMVLSPAMFLLLMRNGRS